jgi:WD40 repeat protein
LTLFNSYTGALQSTLRGHTGWINSLHWKGNDNVISTCDDGYVNFFCTFGLILKVKIWNIERGICTDGLDHEGNPILRIQCDLERNILASTIITEEADFYLWDLKSKETILKYHDSTMSSIEAMVLSPNKLYTSHFDGAIRIWDLRNMHSPVNTMTDNTTVVMCLQLVNDKLISGCFDSKIRVCEGYKLLLICEVYDADKGTLFTTIGHHTQAISCLRADENKIVSGGLDSQVTGWLIIVYNL